MWFRPEEGRWYVKKETRKAREGEEKAQENTEKV